MPRRPYTGAPVLPLEITLDDEELEYLARALVRRRDDRGRQLARRFRNALAESRRREQVLAAIGGEESE